jgi:hypothetical protein
MLDNFRAPAATHICLGVCIYQRPQIGGLMRWIRITIGDLLDRLLLEEAPKLNLVLIAALIFNFIVLGAIFWAL